jgi:hypothetical protein
MVAQKGHFRVYQKRPAFFADRIDDFPQSFVTFKKIIAPDAARSIGFSLINAFTQKLGGSLQLANAETGARTSLIFPLNNAA